ncbi:phosphoglucosamine mutase, partial [Vibrio parahaemolyticus AQ3810]
VVVN